MVGYLELEHGTETKVQAEHGDFGNYGSFWNPDQQETGEEQG